MPRCNLSLPHGRCGVVWRFPRRDGVALRMAQTHRHDEFEVDLVTSGRGTYVVNGQRRAIRTRSLIWLFPDQEHMLDEFSPDFMMWIVVISPEFTAQMAERVPILAERDPGRILLKTLATSCTRHLDAVAQELSTGFQPLDCHELGLAWWLASAWESYQHGESRDAGPLHSAVPRAMALLHEDASKDLNMLAEETCLSPSRLSRLFKRQAGMSITDFRNNVRLETFMGHAGGNGASMSERAREAGFGSYAQFSRVFRQRMGCSPEAYFHGKQPKAVPLHT